MKTNKARILLSLAFLAIVSGCSVDELPGTSPETGGNASGSPSLNVRVSDRGYALPDAATRAVDNVDYTTTFTAGDQIGVFALRGGSVDSRVNNLCLTASTKGSSLVWLDTNGKAPLYIANATYYAYYPYRQTLSGNLVISSGSSTSAPDAPGFFAGVITAWSPSTDQGTSSTYTAQDLMIARCIPGGSDKCLSFSLTHQMALVVIDLPEVTSSSGPSSSGTSPAFSNFKPYHTGNGTYRYLLKPSGSASPVTLSGSYTDSSGRREWSFTVTATDIEAGKYRVYQVDGE